MNTYNLALKDLTVDTIYTVDYKGSNYQMCLVNQTVSGNDVECEFVNTNSYLYDPMATLVLGSNDTNIKNGTVTVSALEGKNLNFDIDGDLTQTGEYLSSKDVLQLMDNNKNGIVGGFNVPTGNGGFLSSILEKAEVISETPFSSFGKCCLTAKQLFVGRRVWFCSASGEVHDAMVTKRYVLPSSTGPRTYVDLQCTYHLKTISFGSARYNDVSLPRIFKKRKHALAAGKFLDWAYDQFLANQPKITTSSDIHAIDYIKLVK